jgi:hypothetical protein
MNHNKALIANARKLLVVIWNILTKKQSYYTTVFGNIGLLLLNVSRPVHLWWIDPDSQTGI